MEQWRCIKGFEGYSVSSEGRIKNNRTDRVLKQTVNKGGYCGVVIRPAGRMGNYKCIRPHREVALAFLPNPDNKPQINHKDGVKTHNWMNNLEWVTHKENAQHALVTGLTKILKGESNGMHRLKESQVREVLASPNLSCVELGNILGASPRTINSIRNRRTWKHVNIKD